MTPRETSVNPTPTSEPTEPELVFVLGSGNHSAICGATTPVKVVDPTDASEPEPPPAK
jgi:hypothetical protein